MAEISQDRTFTGSMKMQLKTELKLLQPDRRLCFVPVNQIVAKAFVTKRLIALRLSIYTSERIFMKFQLRVLAITLGLVCGATAFSQSTAPAGKASAALSSSGAPAAKESAAPAAKTSAAPMAKTATTPAAKTATPAVAAAGGGDGKVWVNTKSKTYHCEGTKFYGKTKVGEYLTEADAKAKGNHADHGKACTK